MALPKVYKLGGVNVVDINGAPHYAGTQIPLKRNPQTGAPVQTYDLAGQSVFDLNGAPHYLQNEKPLQVDQQGRPISYVAPVTTEQNTPPTAPTAPTTGSVKPDPTPAEQYKTAFKAGENKMEDMLKYFGSQNNGENLKTWAKANPALAYKEFKKAGMAGKEPFGYDEVEFGKLKENPAEAAKKLDIKIYDGQVEQTDQQKAAQAFKNTMTEITKGLDLSKYNDLGYNPFQIDPGTLLEKSVDFNIPGLEGTLGNYGTADYSELMKKYPNIFSNK